MLMPFVNGKMHYRHFKKSATNVWVKPGLYSGGDTYIYEDEIYRYNYYSAEELRRHSFTLLPIEWKEVPPTRFLMKLVSINSTENATSFYFQKVDESEEPIPMNLPAFQELMKKATVVAGVFNEEWTYVRRGCFYFLVPAWYKDYHLKSSSSP